MKYLIPIILVLVLEGCSTTKTVAVDTATIASSPTVKIDFDKRLLTECETLTHQKSSREEDVQEWITDTTGKYVRCAILKKKENAEIKKALNIKD